MGIIRGLEDFNYEIRDLIFIANDERQRDKFNKRQKRKRQ